MTPLQRSLLWPLWFPFVLGISAIIGTAVLYIRWDMQQLRIFSRRIPLILKLKATAPLLVAFCLFSLEHLAWKHALPWFAAVFVKDPYTNEISLVLGRTLLHVFVAVITYLISDKICRYLLHSPFQRSKDPIDPIGAEGNQFAVLYQGLPGETNSMHQE